MSAASWVVIIEWRGTLVDDVTNADGLVQLLSN